MPSDPDPHVLAAAPDLAALSAFLHLLAQRVERDPVFGRQLSQLLVESGLLGRAPGDTPRAGSAGSVRARTRARGAPARAAGAHDEEATLPDPFALLRAGGATGLRARLDTLDLSALRQLVRQYHLDPARISARWNNRERLTVLIFEQVRARADHGKAFAQV
ncbi:MAG TPA: hypothetical protein VGN32_06525 [Ktedonobacterales bacterium]|nr:hypothetical protein [Ktedonobacterales bacterium]